MSWVRVDDAFPMHPKAIGLSDEAVALWLRGLCYANMSRTDGRIPRAALSLLSRSRKPDAAADELVRARLWLDDGDAWQVHDFAEYQASKDTRKALTEAKTKRQNEWRKRHGRRDVDASTSGLHDVYNRDVDAPVDASVDAPVDTTPHPTPHPHPTPKIEDQDQRSLAVGPVGTGPDNVVDLATSKAKPSKAQRGTRCPSSDAPDVDAWLVAQKLPALDSAWGADVARFLDYWAAVAGAKGTKLNWSATWRNYAADPRFPHPEGAAPGRKRVLAPSAAQQSPIPEPTGPASFIRESLAERGVTVPEVPIGDYSALFAVAEGRH